MTKNGSVAPIVLLSVYSVNKEGEAWRPNQPELRQDAELKAIPYQMIDVMYTHRST